MHTAIRATQNIKQYISICVMCIFMQEYEEIFKNEQAILAWIDRNWGLHLNVLESILYIINPGIPINTM